MALHEYRRKRDFQKTPEPPGAENPRAPAGRFVIQKHDARRLHYDLRLELEGVMLSWAVPKGPSLDPREKRLAVQVEDHPIEYGDFEGVIPEGEYGGGTVLLWDRGMWTPWHEPREALKAGTLKFNLAGEKLRGGFTLVRIKPKPGESDRNWLLIKERDAEAKPEEAYSVIGAAPYSVATGRTMTEIAKASDRIWRPSQPLDRADQRVGQRAAGPGRDDFQPAGAEQHGAERGPQPAEPVPPAAKSAKDAPDGEEWLHELYLGGQAVTAVITADRVRVRHANGEDWTARLPEIVAALGRLPVQAANVDGQLAVLNSGGKPEPRALRAALDSRATAAIGLHLNDVSYLQGFDVRPAGLAVRKGWLRELLTLAPARCLAFTDHIAGHGPHVLEQARRLGVPGILSRKADGAYPKRAGRDWRLILFDAGAHAAAEELGDSAGARAAGKAAPRVAVAVVSEPGLEVCGVRISNPDKVLYPEEQVTKRVLAHYYERVADWILPHIVQRPLSLYRCPDGHEGDGFFQKHLTGVDMPQLHESPVRAGEGKDPYITLDGVAGLISLAQLAVLEIHPWGSRADDIERPDRMIFDLDPGPGVVWRQVMEAARDLRAILVELGLASFVKTSGGKGLHVVVPLTRRSDWDEVKNFSGAVAKRLAEREPKRYTASMAKWAREGRIFVDFLRNVRGATCVAAFSTRARPGAAVSAPLHWDELDAHPIVYTVMTLPRRLASLREDPWAGFLECRQVITKAMVKAVGLGGATKRRSDVGGATKRRSDGATKGKASAS